MALIKGIFKPPLIGSQEAPIKIAGPGQCEVTSNGLKIIGFKQLSKVNIFQLLALFFCLFFEPTDRAAAMLDTLSSSGVKCKG